MVTILWLLSLNTLFSFSNTLSFIEDLLSPSILSSNTLFAKNNTVSGQYKHGHNWPLQLTILFEFFCYHFFKQVLLEHCFKMKYEEMLYHGSNREQFHSVGRYLTWNLSLPIGFILHYIILNWIEPFVHQIETSSSKDQSWLNLASASVWCLLYVSVSFSKRLLFMTS